MQKKQRKSIGFKVGVALGLLHLCLAIFAYTAYTGSRSSTAGLAFIWFFVLDAPIFFLTSSFVAVFGKATPLILYAVFGSALWFLIPWLIDMAFIRIFSNGKQLIRAIIVIIAIPVVLVGFSRLSRFSIKREIQSERPDELKKVLNRASSDFLTERVVFEDNNWATVSCINRMNLRPAAGMELVVATTDRIVFLDESYRQLDILSFNQQRFKTIVPLHLDEIGSCGFLAYRYGKGVWLFDSEGKEIWAFTQTSGSGVSVDGAQSGDIDGDGKTEFAVYYRYRDGIHLLDDSGKTRWTHPVDALGHLEIADLNGDGKAEIIYDNSNNASGKTKFTVVDAAGTIVDEMDIKTQSYEFALTHWRSGDLTPHILLTEEAKIRIVDLKGQAVISLEAPGCRPFGDVNAATVKFKKDAPDYLAVKKNLHPDLSVLYVYDYDGNLVYQKTEVVEGVGSVALAVVPMPETGNERLLVGSVREHKPQVLEYSLTR